MTGVVGGDVAAAGLIPVNQSEISFSFSQPIRDQQLPVRVSARDVACAGVHVISARVRCRVWFRTC